jgi:hypothetical protein
VSRQTNRILGVVFLVVGVEHIEEGAGVLTSKEHHQVGACSDGRVVHGETTSSAMSGLLMRWLLCAVWPMFAGVGPVEAQ